MQEEFVSSLEEVRLLDRLRLTAAERAAIRRQGSISREQRRGKDVFKLRFRMPPDGRQCVRYVGSDPVVAEAMQQVLTDTQRIRRLDRELGRLKRQIRRKLRSSKEETTRQLEQAGYHFHGSAIRRKRASR